MQLITGGDYHFDVQVPPFSETGTFHISNPTAAAAIPTPVPQKLRFIRSSNMSSSQSSQRNDMPFNFNNFHMNNLGILANQVCGVNVAGNLLFKPPAIIGKGGNNCAGSNESSRFDRNFDPKYGGAGGCDDDEEAEDDSFSTSMDDEDDSSPDFDKCGSRKRKRNSMKKLKGFVEKLTVKVLDRQERMYKELIDVLERKEKERRIKEDAWRQQEMERMKMNEEVRAQENARNLALISYIQEAIGHKVEVPLPLATTPSPAKSEVNVGSSVALEKVLNTDSNNKRWSIGETQALVVIRTTLEQKSRDMGCGKSPNIWDEISSEMSKMGHNRTAKKCKEKWENMTKYFKRSLGSGGKKRGENSKTCLYFNDLNILYKTVFGSSGNVSTEDMMNSS